MSVHTIDRKRDDDWFISLNTVRCAAHRASSGVLCVAPHTALDRLWPGFPGEHPITFHNHL
jgi:hypothetical protein